MRHHLQKLSSSTLVKSGADTHTASLKHGKRFRCSNGILNVSSSHNVPTVT